MMMSKRLMAGLLAAAMAGALPACAAPLAPAAPALADAQSRKIVAAANALIDSLSPEQKAATLYAFNDATQRARWSNFPTGVVARKGVKWGDLNTDQRGRLLDLLNVVLSPEGVKMVREQMEADEYLKSHDTGPPTGGPGGGPPRAGRGGPPPGFKPGVGGGPPGGGLLFGSDLYYTAFLGAPSTTQPWMLQFGGHHLAINATVVGPNLTITPSLTGGQPVTYDKDGEQIYIVEHEVKQAQALIDGLTPAQKSKAVLSDKSIDLILGPGHDGQTLQPEGLPASAMTAAQKAQLIALIEARLCILNADDFAAAMARVKANLDQTWFAWYGPTTSAGGAYFRVTGPTLVLEFSPQDTTTGGVSNHLHNMYRDPTNDYGTGWTSIK